MKKNVMAVFGYNNTRLYDVLKIRELVSTRLGAELLLVKEGITDADLAVTPYCLDYRPEDPGVAYALETYLDENGLNLRGCLPFSDKGVVGGAYAAAHFGLFGDDCASAPAMLDKSLFRKLERGITVDSEVYKKPFFEVVHGESELRRVWEEKGAFFIKPTSEGNSRGCMKIADSTDLDRWLVENPSALAGGVICEELLSLDEEYSFDGVDGLYWITKKFTTTGAYRAEYQHIIPAPFAEERKAGIHRVLEPVLRALGTNGGAFHHEFFLLPDGRVASVEPNRRPAGMWLWDLAEYAFPAFSPWTRWIDRCAGLQVSPVDLVANGHVGVRGVISDRTGTLTSLRKEAIEATLSREFGDRLLRISFLKADGSAVRAEARDNADFLGFVAIRNTSYDGLLRDLERAEKIFLAEMEVSPCA
jgi:hypothetical protein